MKKFFILILLAFSGVLTSCYDPNAKQPDPYDWMPNFRDYSFTFVNQSNYDAYFFINGKLAYTILPGSSYTCKQSELQSERGIYVRNSKAAVKVDLYEFKDMNPKVVSTKETAAYFDDRYDYILKVFKSGTLLVSQN